MNDPFYEFEAQLRSARPAALPPELKARLASPPALPNRRRIIPFLASLSALSAAAAAWIVSTNHHICPTPPDSNHPLVAESRESRVTNLRPVGVVSDNHQRLWRLVEVAWVDSDSLVSSPDSLAVISHEHHRAIVPVAITFE
jgi:hypothetical protein